MKKKLLALLLCTVLLFSFAACGPDVSTDSAAAGTDTSSADTSSDGKTERVPVSFDETMDHMFLATDIKNHSIVVFDLNACDGDYELLKQDSIAVVWEWDADEDKNCKLNVGAGIDAAKYRYSPYYEEDVIIACSSSGWAGVISYERKTVLWEYMIGDGPHSIELMPNSGDIVVACSSGADSGKLAYVPLSAGRTTPSHTLFCPSGHGVMWDPENEHLWVLEYSQVFACKVQGEGTNTAKLVRLNGSGASFGGQDASGHAFSPVYGQPGKYWVSAGKLWQFDTETETLTRVFSNASTITKPGIKGIGSFADGTIVETYAGSGGNTTYDWSCRTIRIITMQYTTGKVKVLKPVVTEVEFEDREFYKVHPFTKDYQ